MFNTTILAPRQVHEHIHIEIVDPSIEKAARFLDETQAEAHKRLVEALLLSVPGIDVHAVQYEMAVSSATLKRRHHISFRLNGKTFDIGLDSEEYDNLETVVGKIAETIAREILNAAAAAITRPHIGFRR